MAIPGVKSYFDQTITGLANGEIDVQELRDQAIRAREELVGIKSGLGSSGGILDGYLGILNQFIRETDSLATQEEKRDKP